jgi:hypothetical protein
MLGSEVGQEQKDDQISGFARSQSPLRHPVLGPHKAATDRRYNFSEDF